MDSYWWKNHKSIQSKKNAANISRCLIVNMIKSLTNQQINAHKTTENKSKSTWK